MTHKSDDEIELAITGCPESPELVDTSGDADLAQKLNEELNGTSFSHLSYPTKVIEISDTEMAPEWLKDVKVKKEVEIKKEPGVRRSLKGKERVRRASPSPSDSASDSDSSAAKAKHKAKKACTERKGHAAKKHHKRKYVQLQQKAEERELVRRLREEKYRLKIAELERRRLQAERSAADAAPPALASIPPPPSVAPPPPSVAPPAPVAAPAAPVPKALGRRPGRKPRRTYTADEYLHVARAFAGPQWRTPTTALAFLHRAHQLLDVLSADSLRHAWTSMRTSGNSPVKNDAVAAQLGLTNVQLAELRDLVKAYDAHQVVLSTSRSAQPVEPLIAQEMEKRAKKEKKVRKEAREARGETVGRSLLQASQDLVTATRDAMTMHRSLHRQIMERLKALDGNDSGDDFELDEDESDETSSSLDD